MTRYTHGGCITGKIRIGTAHSCIGRTTLPRNGDYISKDGFPGGDRPGENEAVTRTETKYSGSCPVLERMPRPQELRFSQNKDSQEQQQLLVFLLYGKINLSISTTKQAPGRSRTATTNVGGTEVAPGVKSALYESCFHGYHLATEDIK